ncbi:MAG: cytochrome d ubiquinol oxidase subunit II [Ignavibacteria bacterium]|jgi:cytochrome d ubiquinol oxidase subunit II|nr:cytochrome d ubiquinol oxidase subunit II [Ignavibacteria bacterium]
MELNIIWFILIIVLLIGYAVLDGFDLGMGVLYLTHNRENSRPLLLKAIAPFWSGNEVWLVAGGGALFAAFPYAYASIFSGLYIALMLLLVGTIFRGIGLEFRNKENSIKWQSRWDIAISVSSILILLVFGVAVGNFMQGLPIDALGNIQINVLLLFTPFPLIMGLLSVAFFAMHGAIYGAMKTEGDLQAKLIRQAKVLASVSIGLFILAFFVFGNYSIVNIIDNVFNVVALAVLLYLLTKKKCGLSIVISGLIALLYIANIGYTVFPNFVVSTIDTAYNLNIYDASSSQETLKIMLIIAGIGVPIVLAYTVFVYRAFRGKVQMD